MAGLVTVLTFLHENEADTLKECNFFVFWNIQMEQKAFESIKQGPKSHQLENTKNLIHN